MTEAVAIRRSRVSRSILKGSLLAIFLLLALGLIAVAVAPTLISSGTGRRWAVSQASESLQRPVSVDDLSLSWSKGIRVSNLVISNKDGSPFFRLDSGRMEVRWLALAAGRMVISALEMNGFSATVVRDRTGRTSIDDLLGRTKKEEASHTKSDDGKEQAEAPAICLDAHFQGGAITLVDQRLKRTTEIRNLTADIAVPSLSESVDLALQGDVVIDDQPAEPLSIVGKAIIAPHGRIDPEQARGTLKVTSNFAALSADFDLSRLAASATVPAARAAGTIDLGRAADLAAGLVGFPPGLAIQGSLQTSFTVQGIRESTVLIKGQSRVTDLSISGGPFAAAPLRQRQLDFLQTLTVDSAAKVVTVKPVALQSARTSLSLEGNIRDFIGHPDCDLKLSGTADLYELTGLARAMALIPADVEVGGTATLALAARGRGEALRIDGSARVERIAAKGRYLGGKLLKEKSLDIRPDLTVDIPGKRIAVTSLQVNGTAVALRAQGFWNAEGSTEVQATLTTRLGDLKQQASGLLPERFPAEGTLSSSVTLQGNPSRSLSVSGEHVLAGLKLAPGVALGQTTVTHDLEYNPEEDRLSLKKLVGVSDAFSFNAAGTATELSRELRISSRIKATVALEKMVSLLAGWLPEKLSAQGNADLDVEVERSAPESGDAPSINAWKALGTLSVGAIEYEDAGSVEAFKTSQLTLDAGKAALSAHCLVNRGPVQLSAGADLTKKKPEVSVTSEGKGIALTQNLRLLGYIVPVFIGPPGTLTGEGSYSLQAAWQGFDWNSDISRTLTGNGELRLANGAIQTQGVLDQILRFIQKRDSFVFEEITSAFHMGEGTLYNDKTVVDGQDIDFTVTGWTSLVFDPAKGGNPMEHAVSGDFAGHLSEDAQRSMVTLGGGTAEIPIVIAGTVQNPRVRVKLPQVWDILKGLSQPAEKKQKEESGSGAGGWLRRLQKRPLQPPAPQP